MAVIQDIIAALWQHDFAALADPILLALFTLLCLPHCFRNGLLPASFLPGDNLLILAGALIAWGYGFSAYDCDSDRRSKSGLLAKLYSGALVREYQNGEGWLAQLPAKYHQRATCMFDRHGLLALLAGRFLAFVRTLLPTMANFRSTKPPLPVFNWLSGLLWVSVVTSFGYALV